MTWLVEILQRTGETFVAVCTLVAVALLSVLVCLLLAWLWHRLVVLLCWLGDWMVYLVRRGVIR